MKSTPLNGLLLISIFINLWTSSALASPPRAFSASDSPTCSLLLRRAVSAPNDPLLYADLLQLQRAEVANKSVEEVKAMNEATIASLDSSGDLTGALTVSAAVELVKAIRKNPVINDQHKGVYDQCDVQIGFCFGRAAFFDIALRKLGVDRRFVRKAWAVGKFGASDGGLGWQFHVATIVRLSDGKWYALDDLLQNLKLVDGWFKQRSVQGVDQNLRLYITDIDKFSVSTGPYDATQTGVNLDRKSDWYKGFYQDLFAWFDKQGGLESLGIKPVAVAAVAAPQAPAAAPAQARAQAPAPAPVSAPVQAPSQPAARVQSPAATITSSRPVESGMPSVSLYRQSIQSRSFEQSMDDFQRYNTEYGRSGAYSQDRQTYGELRQLAMDRVLKAYRTNVSELSYSQAIHDFHRYNTEYSKSSAYSLERQIYDEFRKLAMDRVQKVYRSGVSKLSFDQSMDDFHRYNTEYSKSGAYSLERQIYDEFRKLAMDQVLKVYRAGVSKLSFDQSMNDFHKYNTEYGRSGAYSLEREIYDKFRNLAMDQVQRVYRAGVSNLSFDQSMNDFHKYNTEYGRSGAYSLEREIYDKFRNLAMDQVQKVYRIGVSKLSLAQATADLKTYQSAYQNSGPYSLERQIYDSLRTLAQARVNSGR